MKKRMVLALVLVFALLCLACSNDADNGASSSESVSVAEMGTESSAESTSSADGTSGETSTVESASSDTSSGTSGTVSSTSSNPSESRDTNSETSSDTSSESSKPAENSENSKPTEGSENGGSVDTSSGSGNPSQTGHKHEYVKSIGKPSTCTEDGYMVYTCSCGDSYKGEVLPATGHFLTESIAKEPTETKRGTMRYRCSNRGCDYEETREIYSWNELAQVVEERILYWVNKYRAEEGAPTLTMSKKLAELDEYRAQQALQGGEHAGHNLDDISKAAEATKCGTFNDYTIVDDATGELLFTPRWAGTGMEAWCGYGMPDGAIEVGDEQAIDKNAKKIVDAFRASAGHWAYVGGKDASYNDYIYVGIGVSGFNLDGDCYITVCRYNPDEKGYEHVTMDADGRLHSEWVKD